MVDVASPGSMYVAVIVVVAMIMVVIVTVLRRGRHAGQRPSGG